MNTGKPSPHDPPPGQAVLIVDDNAPMREALRDFLSFLYGPVVVLEAAGVNEAAELAQVHRPRVIVMDVNLPDGDGIDLTSRLKAQAPETIIIVISLHAD